MWQQFRRTTILRNLQICRQTRYKNTTRLKFKFSRKEEEKNLQFLRISIESLGRINQILDQDDGLLIQVNDLQRGQKAKYGITFAEFEFAFDLKGGRRRHEPLNDGLLSKNDIRRQLLDIPGQEYVRVRIFLLLFPLFLPFFFFFLSFFFYFFFSTGPDRRRESEHVERASITREILGKFNFLFRSVPQPKSSHSFLSMIRRYFYNGIFPTE